MYGSSSYQLFIKISEELGHGKMENGFYKMTNVSGNSIMFYNIKLYKNACADYPSNILIALKEFRRVHEIMKEGYEIKINIADSKDKL